ncbi:MAG: hypothetical protein H6743_03850 [Rickettsiaceae bacterium]|nr:hypothetical protein [Rickettsiaceae bacterium]
MKEISEKHLDILKFIMSNNRPTLKNIADNFGFNYLSSLQRYTDLLVKKGYIKNTGSGFIAIVRTGDDVDVCFKIIKNITL